MKDRQSNRQISGSIIYLNVMEPFHSKCCKYNHSSNQKKGVVHISWCALSFVIAKKKLFVQNLLLEDSCDNCQNKEHICLSVLIFSSVLFNAQCERDNKK